MTVNLDSIKFEELPWNVIGEQQYQSRVRRVFEQTANMLINTLGPYGATTVLENFGQTHITKDGWQILKKLRFDDPTDNAILHMLLTVSAQVVIKVGDGSTSSIVAANQILKAIEARPELKKVRPKDLIKSLTKVSRTICSHILERSTKIDPEKDPALTDIYKLAMISTNGDEEVSEIIQKIYQDTNNPFIEYNQSKTNVTHYEIIEGYQGVIMYMNPIYANNDNGTCEINRPLIMMFDHQIDKENHYTNFIQPAIQMALQMNTRLVVIAPHYDRHLIDLIRAQANSEYKSRGTTTVVYTKATLTNNLFQEQYNDFAIMAGAQLIRQGDIEDITNADPENLHELLNDFIGQTEKIYIGARVTRISGFIERNDHMYDVAMKDATSKYKVIEQQHAEMNIVNTELYELKKRISKLKGRMGVVYVGGGSQLEKAANLDLVEDAVKACESAYNYGYNIGGNLIIPVSIQEIMRTTETTELEATIYNLLSEAFRGVYTKVLENKFTERATGTFYEGYNKDTVDQIIFDCIQNETVFDLITDTYSKEVINPCHTDIEILSAALSIVSMLVSSNQYISIKLTHAE